MNRRILFVSESAAASPTRYRALTYFELLRNNGFDPRHIAVTGLLGRIALLNAARDCDIIVVLRKSLTPWLCRILKRNGRKLIFDFDDALFLQDDGDTPPHLSNRFAAMAKSVHAVWAGNDYLAEMAAVYCPNVQVLPTSIDPLDYPLTNAPPPPPTPTRDTFDVVWIGSSSTRKYLEALLPTLAIAAKKIPSLRLKVIADFDLPTARAMGIPTVPVQWSQASEARELATAHVGIAPLPDDPWTRGKCGLKILQYMAASLPVIASPVGVQSALIIDGETGLFASSSSEWLTALERLYNQNRLRADMGSAGRERAVTHYSTSATFKKMMGVLNSLASPAFSEPRHEDSPSK